VATELTPPSPPTRGSGPVWGRLILGGQVVSLALAVVTLGVCAYRLAAFAAGPSERIEVPEPPATGAKPDEVSRYNNLAYTSAARQAIRTQERVIVSTSAGLLVGVALACVGIALSLTAAATEISGADGLSTAARVGRWAPGAVALVCAALVTAVCAAESKPTTGVGAGLPANAIAIPPSVGQPTAGPQQGLVPPGVFE